MQRGYFHKRVIHPQALDDNVGSTVPEPSKRKSNRKPPKPNEVISICHEVLVGKEYYADVAKRHNISIGAISKYITKARKNPKFIKELYSKQDALSTNISHVTDAINLHIEQSKVITRAKDIMNTMEV